MYFCSYDTGAAQDNSPSPRPDIHFAGDQQVEGVIIPGPLRSFLRMGGISQKIGPEDVLPLLARNVYLHGYESGVETEFLRLLDRYVHQARELQVLASSNGTIHVANCTDATQLLQILGYQFRQGCGQKGSFLSTASPERAFLTIDSGFPLTLLEEDLRKGVPFSYSFPSTRVPILFHESDWIGVSSWKKKNGGDVVDVLIHEPSIARLYSAMARMDIETGDALRTSPGLRKLLPYGPVLDFYGSQIAIQAGHVMVPGGSDAERGWKDLVGVSLDSPGDFVMHLVAKDGGWMAVYFDALSRVNKTQQIHLTQGARLKRLYEAFQSDGPNPAATKGVFAKGSELLILYTRLEWTSTGGPYVPGNLDVWKEIFNRKPDSKLARDWAKRSRDWRSSEQLLEGVVALCREETDSGPPQMYLLLTEIDSKRPADKRLADGTVRMVANTFAQFNSWYTIFAEFPELDDASISSFVNVAEGIDKISNQPLRSNTLGSFQANVGIWQILARQGEIPPAEMNASWQKVVEPFAKISSSPQLFDAARSSLGAAVLGATGKKEYSQSDVVSLLTGPAQQEADGRRVHQEMAAKILNVMDDQRLASLDTLFALNDGLHELAQGKGDSDRMLSLASQLRDFELPRPIFTKSEKIQWSPAVYSSRHAELQAKTDLAKLIKASASPSQLETARGQLAPFFRDTLVGFNYAYYEPPDAQILHNNPLFVRSHDFAGVTIIGAAQLWGPPDLIGVGTPAGGGAYLMGSLADLPYVLASTEEDFIAPENVQALVWKEMVPDLLVSGTLPRWWKVSPSELHAVTLYQKSGEELLLASVKDPAMRKNIINILADRMTPRRLEQVDRAIQRRDVLMVMQPPLLPADTFYLASEYRRRFPDAAALAGPASQELSDLCRKDPADTNAENISKDFGVPRPTLTRSYSRELLNLKPFPVFGGYSYRLFGESWDSSNLYWARLADEMGYSPVMLNRLAPELTGRMAAKIFATDLDDWPAVLQAMRETGDEFRKGKLSSQQVANLGVPR
ncbi:hypothetical protein [Acidobacterium sp. S8]|uniref:hypothetical protein n=1 Tax=Acidobacterium sp. S8 TaxID=1641854 RepID=UPI001C20673B|nr:hypothetical protein [Acidobacterium sp. S8]